MIGVVLWTDCEDRQAVIWCEDHGDLAYLTGAEASDDILEIGDVVRVDVQICRNVRRARSAQVVKSGGALRLVNELTQHQSVASPPVAEVVPFRPAGGPRALSHVQGTGRRA